MDELAFNSSAPESSTLLDVSTARKVRENLTFAARRYQDHRAATSRVHEIARIFRIRTEQHSNLGEALAVCSNPEA